MIWYSDIRLDTTDKLLQYLKDERYAPERTNKENLTPSRGGVSFLESGYSDALPAKVTVSRGKVTILVQWFKPEIICRVLVDTYNLMRDIQNTDYTPKYIRQACHTYTSNKANFLLKPAIVTNLRNLTVSTFEFLKNLGRDFSYRICEVYSEGMINFLSTGNFKGHQNDWHNAYPDGQDEDGFDIYDDDIYDQGIRYSLSDIENYVSKKESEDFDERAFQQKYRYRP
jgi:hypothetical protein